MSNTENPILVEAVLLDDDLFVRESWRIFAEDHGRHFLIFATSAELYAGVKALPKDVPIFVDVELGKERGEAVVARLFSAGFRELYLATGYAGKDLPAPAGVKAVIGKTPPEWLQRTP